MATSINNILSKLRESKSTSITVGQTFENAGYTWKILAIKGEYILIYSEDRKYNPYVVAWRFDISDGSWAQGHYFDDEESAKNYMNKLEESVDDYEEDEEDSSIRVDTYINDEDKVTMSKVKNSIASYPIGTYLRYATKGAINAMNQYTYGLYKTGEDSWSPYSSFVGLATEKSYTGEEVLRNMTTKGAKTIGVKLPKGDLSEAEESDELADNAAYLEFVKKCTENSTWKKIDSICKKYGYKLAPLSYVEIRPSGKPIIRLNIVSDRVNEYSPEIHFYSGKFGGSDPIFEIQTTSYGSLGLEEYTKFISAVTAAKSMVEEVSTIDLYKLHQYKAVE